MPELNGPGEVGSKLFEYTGPSPISQIPARVESIDRKTWVEGVVLFVKNRVYVVSTVDVPPNGEEVGAYIAHIQGQVYQLTEIPDEPNRPTQVLDLWTSSGYSPQVLTVHDQPLRVFETNGAHSHFGHHYSGDSIRIDLPDIKLCSNVSTTEGIKIGTISSIGTFLFVNYSGGVKKNFAGVCEVRLDSNDLNLIVRSSNQDEIGTKITSGSPLYGENGTFIGIIVAIDRDKGVVYVCHPSGSYSSAIGTNPPHSRLVELGLVTMLNRAEISRIKDTIRSI